MGSDRGQHANRLVAVAVRLMPLALVACTTLIGERCDYEPSPSALAGDTDASDANASDVSAAGDAGDGGRLTVLASDIVRAGRISVDDTHVFYIDEGDLTHPAALLKVAQDGRSKAFPLVSQRAALRDLFAYSSPDSGPIVWFTDRLGLSYVDKEGISTRSLPRDDNEYGRFVNTFYVMFSGASGPFTGVRRTSKDGGGDCYPYSSPGDGGIPALATNGNGVWFADRGRPGILHASGCDAGVSTVATEHAGVIVMSLRNRDDTLFFAREDGSVFAMDTTRPSKIEPISSRHSGITEIVSNASWVYFTSSGEGTVWRVARADPSIQEPIATNQKGLYGLDLADDGTLYFTCRESGELKKWTPP